MKIEDLAEKIRSECIRAALEGYENAAISGLCKDGAWEAAISAIRMASLDELLGEYQSGLNG